MTADNSIGVLFIIIAVYFYYFSKTAPGQNEIGESYPSAVRAIGRVIYNAIETNNILYHIIL